MILSFGDIDFAVSFLIILHELFQFIKLEARY